MRDHAFDVDQRRWLFVTEQPFSRHVRCLPLPAGTIGHPGVGFSVPAAPRQVRERTIIRGVTNADAVVVILIKRRARRAATDRHAR